MTPKLTLTSSDFLNFNIDHIEIYGTFKNHEKLFLGLDGDNSSFRDFEGFTFEKTDNIRNYHYKMTIRKDNRSLFAWYRGEQLNEYIETRDYFVVYATAFQGMSFAEIIDFIEKYIFLDFVDMRNAKRTHTLRRIDLALDVRKDISDITYHFKELKQKGSKFFDENGKLQTYYIGEKKNTKNKALLIRVYDKIADIYQKEKQTYYPEYLCEKSVTRLELEFRSELLKNVKLSQFLDRSYSFGLFCLYIGKHTSLFNTFENKDIEKLSRLDKRVNLEDLHHRQLTRNRYVNTFLGYAKKFLYLQGCPIDILLRENIYKPETLEDILLASENGTFNKEVYLSGITQKNLRSVFANTFRNDDSGRD